jgi:hypothetical protein
VIRAAAGRRARRLLSAVVAGATAIGLAALPVAPAAAAPGDPTTSPPPRIGAAATPLQVDLVAVSPPSPDASQLEAEVAITVVLTNTSDTDFDAVRLSLERGAPIVQRVLLHDALADPPATEQLYTEPQEAPGPLPAGASASITYRTTAPAMGLFLDGVYPYDLVAQGRIGMGPYREVGRSPAVVPTFVRQPPAALSLSWVWPLIDVPHVSGSDAMGGADPLFLDDELAASIRSGGRLDRALQVVEAVAGRVRMTLVIDPALVNELLLMSEGYRVQVGAGRTVEGTGSDDAAAWLARLKIVASQHDLVLTGYADPDLDAVAAHGLPQSGPMSPQLAERVSSALGAPYRTDLVWPAHEALTQAAADMALAAGATGILLADTALSGGTQPDSGTGSSGLAGEVRGLTDSALSPLVMSGTNTPAGAAVVLDSSLRRRVIDATEAAAIRPAGAPARAGGSGGVVDARQPAGARVQALIAELAMWPLNDAAAGGYAVLAPERDVDADAAGAAAAILATASTGWTTVTTVRSGLQSAARIDRGGLDGPDGAAGAQLPASLIQAVQGAQAQLGTAAQMLGSAADAALAGARGALVLASSSAWRGDPDGGLRYAGEADAAARAITGGVSVITPDNASYSLSSENSPLILTVRNDLDLPVSVKLLVTPASSSVSGFRADDIGVQVIEPGTSRTLQIPAHFERSGRFEVQAQLTTADGQPLGEPVRLSVLCTAYGAVAMTITIAAFVLLLLLLVFRAVRGMRRSRAERRA